MSAGLLRVLKGRIKSVENTKKITRAMEMVAAAKLKRYQDMMLKGQSFAEGLESLLKRLSGGQNIDHPFLEKREEKNVGIVFIASDTGLCGSYNLDLSSRAKSFIEEKEAALGSTAKLICVGKMARAAVERFGRTSSKTFQDIRGSEVESTVQGLRAYLEEIYLSGEVDAIYVIYSHCKSLTSFVDVTEKLLPLERPEAEDENEANENSVDYIFEPDEKTILERLIPLFFEARTRQIFLESFVSEQIARMNAMHQATKNASEMIDSLVLQRNKIRQAIITKEIIEVVSGAQALKQ